MISFKQFLAEAFDSSYKWTIEDRETFIFADENDVKYIVKMLVDSTKTTLSISFGTLYGGQDGMILSVTNTGTNAIKVYSTIGKILSQEVKKLPKLQQISFTSADPRTLKIYGILMKRIAKQLNTDNYEQDGKKFYIWLR